MSNMHFICRSIAQLCGRISPLLSADIFALVRRYLCPRPQISPSVSFHIPINSANGFCDNLFNLCHLRAIAQFFLLCINY